MARRTTSAAARIAAVTAALAIPACAAEGQVALRFDVPDDPALQPAGAATLTLVAQVGDGPPRATTATIGEGEEIDLGDLPVEDEIWLAAELRSAQEQLVGYGQAPAPIAITATADTEATIPVRRPFVYLAGAGARLVSLDASVPATAGYQGQVATAGAPQVVADVAGTELATITAAGALTYVSTASHGASDLPGATLAGAPLDAVSTPDGAFLVVGHASPPQVSVVEIATGAVTVAPLPAPGERVAVTRGADGGWWAVALISRATTDTGCAPSRLATFPLADPETPTVLEAGAGLSDLGGDPRSGLVVVADRCGDRVLRFDPVAGVLDTAAPVLTISAPTGVAAAEGRVWAVGHDLRRAVPGEDVPDGVVDAWLVIGSATIDGGEPEVSPLPPIVERVLASDLDFPDQDLTQDLHANAVEAYDLVLLPGGEHLALTVTATLHGDRFTDGFGGTVIPTLDVVTQEYWLLATSTRIPSQRVRTRCDIEVGECSSLSCLVGDWECLPDLDVPTVGAFTPTGVTALFGAR